MKRRRWNEYIHTCTYEYIHTYIRPYENLVDFGIEHRKYSHKDVLAILKYPMQNIIHGDNKTCMLYTE